MEKLRDQLKKSPLFVSFEDDELDLVLTVAHQEEYGSGEVIFREGDFGDSLYIVLEGAIEIVKKGAAQDVKLATLRRNNSFGEMSVIDIETRSASAIAAGEATVLRFNGSDLSLIFDKNIKILATLATNIARILSRRLRSIDERIIKPDPSGG
jgi:CRP-like cAMP-binding protein